MSLQNAFENLAVASRQPALETAPPAQNLAATPVRPVGQLVDGAGFSAVGASVLDNFFNSGFISGSTTFNQAAGSLNIVAGTTVNSEFLARSVATFSGSMRIKFSLITSQRIANNNLAVMLADLIGEGLAFNIVNSTTVDVTRSSHGFTSRNVGQFVMLGAVSGAAGVPGRYAIASLPDANTIRLSVSGWPASGSGTCTLFGRSYVRNLFTGTTPTNMAWDAQRNGWATGDTTAAINTTATPGTVIINELTGREVFLYDKLRITSTTPTVTTRASRDENIPDGDLQMHIFLWSYNGTAAPASSTTWTLGHLSVEEYVNFPVYLQGARPVGAVNPIPVSFPAAQPVTQSGTWNVGLNAGTNNIGIINLSAPLLVTDVTSGAITTTTTTAGFVPTVGPSYEVNIPVTAVSGAGAFLDVTIEESDDTGTNWFRVYDFPRITATGMYRSPKLSLTGNRIRYVQTLGGTTPSFTRAVNRLQIADTVPYTRQLIDRTVGLTVLNSTTPSLNIQNCRNLQLFINIGAATTAPTLQLQISEDGGTTWVNVGSSLPATASSTVLTTVNNISGQLARAIVTAAGTGVTAGYVLVKGF